VVTGKARSHIRHYLKTLQATESAHLGERMLNLALRALRVEPSTIDDKLWRKVMSDYGVKDKSEILTDIGLGKRVGLMVAHQLTAGIPELHVLENGKSKASNKLDSITITGSEGMAVQFAQCCRPIPGDPILGFINKDKGLIIHTHDCPTTLKFKLDPDKWLDVEWDSDRKKLFKVNVRLVVANERGMLAKLAAGISDVGANIDNVSVEEPDGSQYANVNFMVQVRDRVHLADLMRNLRKIPEVQRINRVKGVHSEEKIS
jgi:GTP pyrophosphokinase